MYQKVDGDPKQDSDYNEMLRTTAKKLKVHGYFFPSVGISLMMPAEEALRFAHDLERIADGNQRDSS